MQIVIKPARPGAFDHECLTLIVRNMAPEDVNNALATLVESEAVLIAMDEETARTLLLDLENALKTGTA